MCVPHVGTTSLFKDPPVVIVALKIQLHPNSNQQTPNHHNTRPRLVAGCKVFEIESFHVWSIKYRLITKLIIEIVCKIRDEFNEPN